jgi:hypothetical protein
MHPDLEIFLEEAFQEVQPAVPGVGRVVVEPDYDVTPAPADKALLGHELLELVKSHSGPGEVKVPANLKTLARYIRCVSLLRDPLEGPWVEVVPPGNWI